jgi:CheY-like chemotaxis protein
MALHRQHAGTLRVVNDGKQAIDYLTGEREFADSERFPIPDVVLLDIKMPRMDGFGFLTWLRNDSPNHLKRLPVVIMSSSDEQSDVNRAYDLGVNCYMTKPVDWQIFRERMKLLGMFWAEHAETPTP